jgi:hypothetical protein
MANVFLKGSVLTDNLRCSGSGPGHNVLPSMSLVLSSDLIDALRVALAQVMVTEEGSVSGLTVLQGEQANISEEGNEQEMTPYERVKAYLVRAPEAVSVRLLMS